IKIAGREINGGGGYGGVELALRFGDGPRATMKEPEEKPPDMSTWTAPESARGGFTSEPVAPTPSGPTISTARGRARVVLGDPIDVTLISGDVVRGMLDAIAVGRIVVLPMIGERK